MIANNTITPHAVAQKHMNITVLLILVATNLLNLLSIIAAVRRFVQNWSAAAPPPARWIPVGWYQEQHLYERTYPSGKKAWRFAGEDGNWIYPRRSDVAYWGRCTDNETPLLEAE